MSGHGSSCGACKFLRRKCTSACVFAPFFSYERSAAQFAAVHKIFGASNASKLLSHLPMQSRGDAAITICYEAQARVRDPIYGCVAHIFALQQQVQPSFSQPFSLTNAHLSTQNKFTSTMYIACNEKFCRQLAYKKKSKFWQLKGYHQQSMVLLIGMVELQATWVLGFTASSFLCSKMQWFCTKVQIISKFRSPHSPQILTLIIIFFMEGVTTSCFIRTKKL